MTPLEQHQVEIQKNLRVWQRKPQLRKIYTEFYERIIALIHPNLSGPIVEIGSGIGNFKAHFPRVISTDLFPNPWIELVFDAYEMPFAANSVSHLVMIDVFHHLRAPRAFLKEARRVLKPGGRIIMLEPCISPLSFPAYALHHEGIHWREPIFMGDELPKPRDYYTGQGNVTRLFFTDEYRGWLDGWNLVHAERMASLRYLLSGGYSKPSLWPEKLSEPMRKLDNFLSRWPRWFGTRCLIALEPGK